LISIELIIFTLHATTEDEMNLALNSQRPRMFGTPTL